jgi:hypothetical protein
MCFASLVDSEPNGPTARLVIAALGFRNPLAKMRKRPVARSTSRMFARLCSASMPFSVMLLFDPTPTLAASARDAPSSTAAIARSRRT